MSGILRCRHYLYVLIMLVCAVSLCRESTGETLDKVINPRKAYNGWVSDMAGVIDAETKQRLNALIDQLERQTTAEIAVVTIRRTDDLTPKEFATELLNRWGVGKKGTDNGVLVLLVMESRRIEVETGYGVEGVLPDGKVGEILDTYATPRFKQGDFGGGLFAGVRAMAEVIAGEQLGDVSPQPAPRTSARGRFNPLAWLFGFGALVLAMLGYVGWRRSQIRHCPHCNRRMRRLDEVQDDAYLSASQKFEEELGSVDYRVWRCDECQTCKIERVVRWSTSYEDCPQCGNRTLYLKSYTLREPTYEREGEEEITRTCRFAGCTYHRRELRRIPRRQRPTPPPISSSSWGSSGSSSGGGGSSGGSFGGGSSGGGGAGRSW